MLDRGSQTRQTLCSSSLRSPFLFCFAQLFISSSILTSVTFLSVPYIIFVSLLVSSSILQQASVKLRDSRVICFFVVYKEEEEVGLAENAAKGNKLAWVVLVHSLYFRCPSGFCTFDSRGTS